MLEAVGLSRILLDEQLPKQFASVDFFFDDQRVWSVDMRGRGGNKRSHFEIPGALRPHLLGSTLLSVRDSATGECLNSGTVQFSEDETSPQLVDTDGNALSINKWGRLAKTLDRFSNSHELILHKSRELVEALHELGKDPFIVGGTLLGAVRAGALLPHDDDADIAYLSTYSNPVDVAQENFELARVLKSRGYEIVHHGGAHMQLQFLDAESSSEYYIDIFAAFFTPDGFINQPFHVRGKMRRDQLLPFQDLSIGDFQFPGPADVNRWLTVNYDKDWRTPIPGFRLRTKPRTQRRFQNWFGSFNFKRDYWIAFHEDEDTSRLQTVRAEWDHSARWIANHQALLDSASLLELGAGTSSLSTDLAATGRRVVKSDYTSYLPQVTTSNSAEYAHLNLLRLNVIESVHSLNFKGSFDLIANHVLDQTSHFARRNALRLIRASCVSGGTAIATLNGLPGNGVSFGNPTKWHLEPSQLAAECAAFGLSVSITSIDPSVDSKEFRGTYAAVFFLTGTAEPRNELSRQHTAAFRKRAVRSAIRDWRDRRDPHRAFHKQLGQLEKQLDDRRRDLLQLAEAVDLSRAIHTRTADNHVEVTHSL